MSAVLLFILCVWLAYYLAKWFFRFALPRLLLWGVNRHMRNKYSQVFGQQQQQSRQRSQQRRPKARKKGKIIPDDVGEYVEYEDIPTYNEPNAQSETGTTKFKEEAQVSDAEWEEIK